VTPLQQSYVAPLLSAGLLLVACLFGKKKSVVKLCGRILVPSLIDSHTLAVLAQLSADTLADKFNGPWTRTADEVRWRGAKSLLALRRWLGE